MSMHDAAYKPYYDATADRIASKYGVRPEIDLAGPFSYDERMIECRFGHPTIRVIESIRVSRVLIDHNFDLAVNIVSDNIVNAFLNIDKNEGI